MGMIFQITHKEKIFLCKNNKIIKSAYYFHNFCGRIYRIVYIYDEYGEIYEKII